MTNRACGGSPQHSALVGAVKRERAAGGRSLVPVICGTFPGGDVKAFVDRDWHPGVFFVRSENKSPGFAGLSWS